MSELNIGEGVGGWHIQIVTVSLRHFPDDAEASFQAHVPFDASAQAVLLPDNTAFVHTALAAGKEDLTRRDWASLGFKLRDDYGVNKIICDRGGVFTTFNIPKPASHG